VEHASSLKKKNRGAIKQGKRKRQDVRAQTQSSPLGALLGYTSADEVLRRALIKWDALNYQTSPAAPWRDETAFQDWLTNVIIPEAEKVVNEFCRRQDFLKHTGEVETFNGDGFRDYIIATHQPVITVSKLEFKQADGTWAEKASEEYVVRGGLVRCNTVLPEAFQNIRLTYDWGYETIPTDVSHVTSELCAAYLQKRVAYKMGPLVRVSDYRIQFMDPEIFTADLKDRLSHYGLEAGAFA
jgi:hypothetical protein